MSTPRKEDTPIFKALIAAGLYHPDHNTDPGDLSDLPSAPPGDPAAARYADAALTYEVATVANTPEGGRNDALNRACFKLGTLVAAGHLDGQTVINQLSDAARRAGLPPSEIRRVVYRATRDGAQHPRLVSLDGGHSVTSAYTLPPPNNGHHVTTNTPPAPDPPEAGASTWQPEDITDVLDGTYRPPQPVVGARSDRVGMFYPGKVHTVSSESEAGKTWLALHTVIVELERGNAVVYIDFEDSRGGVVGRLLDLGANPAAVRERFAYIRPNEPITRGAARVDLHDALGDLKPSFAVLDGITEAMTLHGLDLKDNVDVARFGAMLPQPIAATGAAVAALDHVTKDREGRGRYSIGGVHKLNAVDGAAYTLDNRLPFGVGITGRSTIHIAKDRPGQLRSHALRSGELYWFADLELSSEYHAGHPVLSASVLPPERRPEQPFRPTTLMARVSAALQRAGQPLTSRDVEARTRGRATDVRAALAALIDEGYVNVQTGPRGARLHTLITPFGEDDIT